MGLDVVDATAYSLYATNAVVTMYIHYSKTNCSDEALLCQGLAQNDDFQWLLAKHEYITSGISAKTEKPKLRPVQALVNLDAPLIFILGNICVG